MSASNKSACDLQAQVECDMFKKAIRVETISAKVKSFFTVCERKSDNTVLVAEGAFLFHTVKHPSSYNAANSTSVIFKTIFSDSEITHKFSNAGPKQKQSFTP